MLVLLLLVVLIAAALSLAYLTRLSFGLVLPSTIFAIAIALYAFSLANALLAGFVAVLAIVAGLVVAAVVHHGPRGILRAAPAQFSPALVLFLVFALGTFILSRGLHLGSWDEFTQWGASVKAVVLRDAIGPYNPIDLAFRSYPPAMTMFEYFALKLGGGWSESNLFWSYQLMFGSLFLPFIGTAPWTAWRRIIVIVPLMVFTPIIINNSFQVVLVDPYLGLLFGYTLALVFTGDTRSRWLWIQVSLALAMLVLTKDSGLFLAIFAAVLFGVKVIRQRLPLTSRAAVLATLAALAGPVLAMVVAYFSWKTLLSVLHVHVIFSEPIDLSTLSGLANGTGRPYWHDVLTNFSSALTAVPIATAHGIPISHLAWFLLAGIALVLLEFARGTRWGTRRDFSAVIVVLVGAVLYTAGLLVLYLYRFVDYEAVRLASFDRYLGTYWLGVTMFITLVCIRLVIEDGWTRTGSAQPGGRLLLPVGTVFTLGWLVAVLLLAPLPSFAAFVWSSLHPTGPRAPELMAESARQDGVGDEDRVWVISEYTEGYEYWEMRYELMPSAVNDAYWSLGTPEDADDVWTADLSVQQWSDMLDGFDYVLVENTSDTFVDTYGEMFDDPGEVVNGALFAVSEHGGRVTLARVP